MDSKAIRSERVRHCHNGRWRARSLARAGHTQLRSKAIYSGVSPRSLPAALPLRQLSDAITGAHLATSSPKLMLCSSFSAMHASFLNRVRWFDSGRRHPSAAGVARLCAVVAMCDDRQALDLAR